MNLLAAELTFCCITFGIGVLELASAGVSMSIFSIVSKVFNIPLLSVATSFVAEEIAAKTMNRSTSGEIPISCQEGFH